MTYSFGPCYGAALLGLAIIPMGCSLMPERSDPLVGVAEPSATLLFGTDAELTSSIRPRRGTNVRPAAQWEISKTFNSGKTRISAVRHDRGSNVTEYYTSTTGPNGSVGRRRAVVRSSGARHSHRR